MYEWSSWRTLVPLLIGIIGLVGFIVYSVYFSSEPLVRRSLFNNPTAISAYFGTLVHGMIVWSLLYYMPLYFEVAKNFSPITSGVAIFPFTFTTAPAAVVVGIVITKTGRYRSSLVSDPSPSQCESVLIYRSGSDGSSRHSVWVYSSTLKKTPTLPLGYSYPWSPVLDVVFSSQPRASQLKHPSPMPTSPSQAQCK